MRRLAAILVLAVSLSACGGDEPETGSVNTGAPEPGSVGAIDAVRCAEVAAAMASAAAAAPQALAGGPGADLGQSVATLEAFASEAPEEIREDVAVIAAGYAAVAEVLEGADFDPQSGQPPPEVIAGLEAASEELNAPEFQEATARVNAWFTEECGVPGG